MDVIQQLKDDSVYTLNTNQLFASPLHFVCVQSYDCIRIKQEAVIYADGFHNGNTLYLWMPTPPGKLDADAIYTAKCRETIYSLIRQNGGFTDIVLDLRNNIGGIGATFYNALLPIFRLAGISDGRTVLMTGRNKEGEDIAQFIEDNGKFIITLKTDIITDMDLLPIPTDILDIVTSKSVAIHILANERTMSSAEIVCVILINNGAKVYGNCKKTGGLSNGWYYHNIKENIKCKIPFYYFCCGNIEYRDGIEIKEKIPARLVSKHDS